MPGDEEELVITRRVGGRILRRRVEDEIIVGPAEFERLAIDPFPVVALRPADLLLVRFEFRNLRISTVDGDANLHRRIPTRPAFLIVDFPPQHLVEEAFAEQGNSGLITQPELPGGKAFTGPAAAESNATPSLPPIPAVLSAHSRLVYKVTDQTIPWTLDGLLAAMTMLPLSVAPHAVNPVRLLRPFDVTITTTVSSARLQRRLLARDAVLVPGTIRSVGRSTATARMIDHRLGRETANAVSAASNLVAELGINPVVGGLRELARLPPPPRAPTDTETAIELPWRMQLSPHAGGAFTHARQPVDHDGRIELWHSRLGVRATAADGSPTVDELDPYGRTVRAIWTRDMEPGPLAPETPDAMGGTDIPSFTKSLTTRDRRMLVDETSNFHLTRSGARWQPPSVDVDRLMLTTLGGWLRSDFDAPTLPDNDFSITEWKHRATMGRDHEVKVVYAGFLFPLGHNASLVKVTERKLQLRQGVSGRIAYLRQRFFIVVRRQTLTYPATEVADSPWQDTRPYARPGTKRLDLAMPFSSASVLTRVTPDLDTPNQRLLPGPFCFTPYVDGSPFGFELLLTDRENQIVEYAGPLMFVERGHNATKTKLDTVTTTYWNLPANERQHRLRGQRVAFAEATAPSGEALDTSLATEVVEFDAAVAEPMLGRVQDEPRFWPVLRQASVVVPAMSALAGASTATTVHPPLRYLRDGYVGNATHVFLEVAGNAAALTFTGQGNRSGGFVTPNLDVTGLSGSKGPLGGVLDKAMDGSMDPAEFFGGLDAAKLFGAVKLSDLLGGSG